MPVPRADLQQGTALVAGATHPLCRIRRLPPQRAFRFAARHHAHPRFRAGRRACVLPRGGRGARSRVLHRPAGRGLPGARFSGFRSGAGDSARGAGRRRRDLGLVGGEARRRGAAMRPRASDQSWRRRILRTEAGIRVARPAGAILAVRHRADRRRAAAAARGVLRGARRQPREPRDGPSRHLRIARPHDRDPARAPRRRASVLAVAGPGRGRADLERAGWIRRGRAGSVRGCRDSGRRLRQLRHPFAAHRGGA